MSAGNRPNDVCSLCDRPVPGTETHGFGGMHFYLGPDWVHGGGREYIHTHLACLSAGCYPEGCDAQVAAVTYIRAHFEPGE